MTALPPSRNEEPDCSHPRDYRSPGTGFKGWICRSCGFEFHKSVPPSPPPVALRTRAAQKAATRLRDCLVTGSDLAAIEVEAVSEYREALRAVMQKNHGPQLWSQMDHRWNDCLCADHEQARSLLQADQVVAAEPLPENRGPLDIEAEY